MIVLITGATGKQGSAGVHLIQGSFEDRSSLLHALKNVDAAFLVQADSPNEVEQGLRFVEVAKEVGLPFLVYGSAEGAGANPPALKGKLEIEEAVKASGLGYAILHPVAFFENFRKEEGWERWLYLGLFEAALKGRKMQMVSTTDIAHFATKAIENPKEIDGRVIPIAGDDLTIEEACKIYGKVQGGTKVSRAPRWISRIVLALLPADLRQLLFWFGEVGYKVDLGAVRKEHEGVRSFEDWLVAE
ncbi:hypothetical protein BCR35DRAFT_310937 [Leucosporidium creatinivorum]|uniref:NmrA-like domain-containing protein n=1 Tax=Leucosporidium creatinivorum TaxID=106004 RepID=A0A1Y2CJH2_9BASI|nr:hypothetical protein BCR35DRAFT_310937 [Leucosporidium creatinivorum]